MRRTEKIPEYPIEVRFQDSLIECYDLISKEIVASKDFKKTIVHIHRSENNTFLLLNKKYKAISKIAIEVKLVKEMNRVATDAGYIFNISMDTSTHGYYFGYYEIGEFSFSDNKLAVIKSFPLEYCTRGCISPLKHAFVGFREDDPIKNLRTYFLAKVDWEDLKIEWKEEIPSAIMSICLNDNRLFLGLKNGDFQIWDIEKKKLIKSFNLFKSTISVIEMRGENLIIASKTGEAALVSKEGSVQWKSKLSEDEIIGIYGFNDNFIALDIKGKLYQLNITSGNLMKKEKWNIISVDNPALVSNVIDFHSWFMVTGYGGIWGFWSKDFDKIYHHYMDDPLIRVLHQHPIGFFSGDDEGYIRFWKLGEVKIRSMSFIARKYLTVPSE